VMSFKEIATRNVARGFRVFPLAVKDKRPWTPHWKEDATDDLAKIEQWAQTKADANVGIPGGPEFIGVDTDRKDRLFELCRERGISLDVFKTYSVESGKPNRAHFYYMPSPEFAAFGIHAVSEPGIPGNIFETKPAGAYLVGEGSVHPEGTVYTATQEIPRIPLSPSLLALFKELEELWGRKQGDWEKSEWGEVTNDGEGRERRLLHYAGKLRHAGLTEDEIYAALVPYNADHLNPPKDDQDLHRIARSVARYPEGMPEPRLLIGGKDPRAPREAVSEWRDYFHTKDEALNAPPVTFLIKDFLQCEGVTAIAAPVRERKSLIALNVAHSLITGEKLFGHFEVVKKPDRVLYLCPEVSLGPFTDRVRKIGLLDFVGERFFYRTMSSEGHLSLADEALQEALPGSVVVLDTAIRFLEGDENSSAHVRAFADSIFALLRNGAEAVILLHHSPKATDDGMMTLENAMRGSGDMGAFLASCWGTRLQDPTDPYKSASFLSNLKQRDFESQDFEVTCGPDCRLHIVPATTVTMQPRNRFRGNRDGRDAEALEFIKANPKLSMREVARALEEAGMKRSKDWVQERRYQLMQENGGRLPGRAS
jgi:hypothetical protein